ncbi:hypothetical protein LTR64_000592 [Lithohypha guttulata]|uniref:uncharacterized protein n=1 Tax=Lithohypha guttulata TaxID=1690604 RepID=UPI002DE18800|nr:hypothetical protein LTR51_005642 [Lithohypha guttulata]
MTQNVAYSPSQIYQRLNSTSQEIRLLKVSSALNEGRIQCQLQTTRLSSAQYVVLSYQWGTSDVSHEILLDGHVFRVRPNLWAFLDVIREQQAMMLWIDALCINQNDVLERNAQVRIMGDIFRSASMVVNWLGAGSQNSRITLAFRVMNLVWSSSSVDNADQLDSVPSIEGVDEDEIWQSVVELCSLPYWNRVWVAQEILLSSNNYLLHGSTSLPWHMFANFISLIDVRFPCPSQYNRLIHNSTAKSYALSKPYTSVPRELTWRVGSALKHDYGKWWNNNEYNLFRILTMFGDRECADPLDHVYALLSLTDEGPRFPIRYGVSVLDLFLTVFRFCGHAVHEGQSEHTQGEIYVPASQRAFFRNARYLAEIMDLVSSYQRTQPYFQGIAMSARGPSPRPEPCFPREHDTLILYCSSIDPDNEPPVLRSNTLRRNLQGIVYDSILHLDDSSTWLLVRNTGNSYVSSLVALITIKDSPQGRRGFKVLEPGPLSGATISAANKSSGSNAWKFVVPPDKHLDLLKATVLGGQPR